MKLEKLRLDSIEFLQNGAVHFQMRAKLLLLGFKILVVKQKRENDLLLFQHIDSFDFLLVGTNPLAQNRHIRIRSVRRSHSLHCLYLSLPDYKAYKE